MSAANEFTTARLVLRRWREADREPFAALNADPLVMEHFPARLSRSETDDLIAGIEAGESHGNLARDASASPRNFFRP